MKFLVIYLQFKFLINIHFKIDYEILYHRKDEKLRKAFVFCCVFVEAGGRPIIVLHFFLCL